MRNAEWSHSRLGLAFARFLSRRTCLETRQKEHFERLVLQLSEQLSLGHNCIRVDPEEQELLKASGLAGTGSATQPVLPLRMAQGRLYLYRYWQYENRLAAHIRRMAGERHAVDGLAHGLDRFFGETDGRNDWQRQAATMALTRSFSIITGGPGTGKTTTVVKILALLQTLAPEPLLIALAGPTGKAAMRLQESIQFQKAQLPCSDDIKKRIPDQVSTLHRLLGARPPSPYFRYDARHPLIYDLVVVDEASMVDLALMSKLLDALKPSARLILLGDKDQLASIESGAVLADLTQALPDHTVELQFTHRFDKDIKNLAELVNSQDDVAAWHWLQQCLGAIALLDSFVVETIAGKYEKYLRLMASGAEIEAIHQARAGFQVLCANKQGKLGVTDINARVEQHLFRHRLIDLSGQWYAGRPVMITENNSVLHLYNGDTGICLPDREQGGRLMVFFRRADGSVKKFLPGRIPQCETVYAMTIHKSQGSEFDDVVIVLPDRINPVLTKELLYTAITRAKSSVAIVAEEDVFKTAVRQKVSRDTGLIEKVAKDGPQV